MAEKNFCGLYSHPRPSRRHEKTKKYAVVISDVSFHGLRDVLFRCVKTCHNIAFLVIISTFLKSIFNY